MYPAYTYPCCLWCLFIHVPLLLVVSLYIRPPDAYGVSLYTYPCCFGVSLYTSPCCLWCLFIHVPLLLWCLFIYVPLLLMVSLYTRTPAAYGVSFSTHLDSHPQDLQTGKSSLHLSTQEPPPPPPPPPPVHSSKTIDTLSAYLFPARQSLSHI